MAKVKKKKVMKKGSEKVSKNAKSKKSVKENKTKKIRTKTSTNAFYQKSKTLKILTAIKPGLAVKDIVEGMKNFYFDGKNVTTYNDKIAILHPFKTAFKAFINADMLYKLLSKLPTEDFDMQQKDDQIYLKAKGLNVKLPAIIDSEVIERINAVNKVISSIKWKPLPQNFLESINLCSFAASQNDTDSTLSCVKVYDKVCVASDSKRIAYATLDSEIKPMYIKASEIKHLVGINPIYYNVTKGWIVFKNENKCIFAIRKIEGDFPKWEHLFDFKGTKIDLPKELLNGVDMASIFTDSGNKAFLTITIGKNICKLIVKTDSGKLKYSAPIEYNKKPFDFVINPDFLQEMMKFSTTITFTKDRAKLETETFSTLTALYAKDDEE